MNSTRQTQCERILRLLLDAHGSWVALPEIMRCAAQYNARIYSLRRAGYNIENRTETIEGIRHSWFRLVDSPAVPVLAPPKPSESWKGLPRLTGLPLFDLGVRP